MKVIAITGGLGTGKSAVLSIISTFGKPTLESDEVVHRIYQDNENVRTELFRRWGSEAFHPDSSVNGKFISDRIFTQPSEKEWLQELMHPYVWEAIQEESQKSRDMLYCAIPLLFEIGWQRYFDETVTVWCDRKTRFLRLMQQGWSQDEITRRSNTQMDIDQKLAMADFGIINTGTWPLLEEQCRRIIYKRPAPEASQNYEHKN